MVRVLLFVALCGGLYVACSRDIGDHPPPLGDCEDPACAPILSSRPPLGGGVIAGGGSGGFGGNGAEEGTLAGTVHVVTSADLTEVRDVTDPVVVKARGSVLQEVSTTSESDGSFRLQGLNQDDSGLWVGAGPFDGSSVGLYLDTLQSVDATRERQRDLLVVTRSVVEEIALTGFLGLPTEFDVQRGTAIVSFVDSNLDPVSGLTVVSPASGSAAVIAYDAGDIYSDLQEGTSTRGTVVIMNVAAGGFPGSLLNIVALVNGLQQEANVRVLRGGVTLATAQITL